MAFIIKLVLLPLSLLPMNILYVISGFIRVFLQFIIRYRKEVITDNLKQSFPNKTELEIKAIQTQFYKHLADLIVEGVKALSISEKNVIERCKITNPQLLDSFAEKQKNVIMVFGHYNNWEWPALACNAQLKHQLVAIYKPIKDKKLNKLFKANRSRFGTVLISMQETPRFYIAKQTFCHTNAFIADQNPSNPKFGKWVDFLNRKTVFLSGPAKIAKKYNLPIIFCDIQKSKRGYYKIKLEALITLPKEHTLEEITISFANRLEQQIKQEPAFWLWSHKRWKHKITQQES